MPYHRGAGVFFIHIPKTGGTSFEKLIKDKYRENWEFWGKFQSLESYRKSFPGKEDVERLNPDREYFKSKGLKYKEPAYHHFTLKDIERAYDIDSLLQKDVRFVSIVRNPYDRLVSMYEYGKQRGGLMLTADKSFKEWFYDRPVSSQGTEWIKNRNGIIPSYVDILDFANYESEVRLFANNYFKGGSSPLPHEKKTVRKRWQEYYDDKMMNIAKSEFGDDEALYLELVSR